VLGRGRRGQTFFRNSRFDGFNSRLGRQREFARKGLIWLTVFAAEWR
jgi:hypothetical protein